MQHRVMQWATGTIGRRALAMSLEHPDLEVVGVRVFDPAKVGQDAGALAEIGEALDDSELMVILLSPAALESDWLRQDIEFALGSKKYAGRVYSVFVGPDRDTAKDMPWILLKLPHRQVESAKDFSEVVKEIKALGADIDMSPSNLSALFIGSCSAAAAIAESILFDSPF